MSKISDLSDGGVIQGGDTLIAVRSGGNVKVTYGGSTTANIDGGTIDGTVIGGTTAAAGSFTTGSFTGNVSFGDNDKAIFGASSDLEIYHNGNNSFITDTGTGSLYLRASDSLRIQSATNEEMIKADADGAVTLYNNNIAKLATTSTGIDVTGVITTDGLTSAGVATVQVTSAGATAEALTVYNTSNSNNSQVDVYFGSNDYDTVGRGLRIEAGRDSGADGIATFYSVDQAEHSDYEAIKILTDGGVTLSHLGSNKLATTSTGIDVSGTVSADGLTVDGDSQLNGDLTIFDGTGDPFIKLETPTQHYVIRIDESQSDIFQIRDSLNGANRLGIANNGDVSLYEDTGTTAKFVWDSSAESLGIGTSSPDATLHANKTAASGDAPFIFENSGTSGTCTSSVVFAANGGGGAEKARIKAAVRGDGYMAFHTNNDTEKMRINSAGNVGIGTSSPNSKLHLSGDGDSASKLTVQRTGATTGTTVLGYNYIGTFSNNEFKVFTNSTEAMRINSSGNVGIGTDSPSSYDGNADNLVIGGESAVGLTLASSATNGRGSIYFADGTSGDQKYRGTINYFHSSDDLTITTAATERMRINSGGTVLVGKTSSASSTVGAELRQNGLIIATTSSVPSLTLNRTTSDGTIADFRKDGSTVGTIGTHNGQMVIGSADTGLGFQGDSTGTVDDAILPVNISTGARRDDAISLGHANGRFKDLYLSGGAYLGGTAAANKLDDYEEGTFTPSFSGGDYTFTYNKQKGSYTKIGNRVFVDMLLYIDSSTAPSGTTDGDLSVTGLPFTFNAQNTVDVLAVSIGFKQQIANAEDSLSVRFQSGNTEFKIHKDLSTGFPDTTLLQASDLTANSRLRIQFSYPTNS